jgi:hypothetical protein
MSLPGAFILDWNPASYGSDEMSNDAGFPVLAKEWDQGDERENRIEPFCGMNPRIGRFQGAFPDVEFLNLSHNRRAATITLFSG